MPRGPVDNLCLVANAWLGLFAVDAVLAVVDELIHLATGVRLVQVFKAMTSLPLLLTAPLVLLGVTLTPRLPGVVFVPPIALISWMGLGASPLTILLFDSPWLRMVLGLTQLLVAGLTAGLVWWHEDRRSFVLTASKMAQAPAWAWRRFAVWHVAMVLLGPVVLGAYLWFSATFGIRHLTAGFVRMNTEGVRIAHRTYTRGAQTIDLIGMIHLGDASVYDQIFDPIPVDGSLILAEGVGDEEGLLEGGTGYDRVAERLGISVQKPMEELTSIPVRNADVDVSTFSPSTLEMLQRIFALYRSDDPATAIIEYMQWSRSQGDPEELTRQLMADILDKRNVHLLEQLDIALTDHERVILPWGAYHLPDIEEGVESRGFARTTERVLTLIPFGKTVP